jgi:hypothetical protein
MPLLPRVKCPRSRHIHWCPPHHADGHACLENCSFCVFRSIASTDRDTSIRSVDTYKSLIISLVISRLDYGNATLYTSRPAIYVQHDAVGAQCCHQIRFSSASVWSRHPCSRRSALAACALARALESCMQRWYIPLSIRACTSIFDRALHRTVSIDSRRRLRSADSELLIVPRYISACSAGH